MPWSELSKSDPVRTASSWLDQIVTNIRNRGYTRQHAVDMAAQAAGITPRRAKALLYGEAFTVASGELQQLRARMMAHLDEEAADLARRSEEVRARRREMETDA